MFKFVLTSIYAYRQIPLSPFSVTSKVFNSVNVESVMIVFVLRSIYAYCQIPLSPFRVTSKVFNSVKVFVFLLTSMYMLNVKYLCHYAVLLQRYLTKC